MVRSRMRGQNIRRILIEGEVRAFELVLRLGVFLVRRAYFALLVS